MEMMHPAKKWFIEEQAQMVVKSLEKRSYEAVYVPSAKEACEKVIQALQPGQIIGTGGSITLNETGILDKIRSSNYTLIDPDSHLAEGVLSDKIEELRREVLCKSDVFITSINALTLDGKMVSIDGLGNRLAAMLHGNAHKVIVVCGINKIVPDLERALWRAYNVAAVCNVKRLNMNPPCAKALKCVDCSSEERICRATLILEKQPIGKEYLVIIIGEHCGF